MNSPLPTLTGGKRVGSQDDLAHDVQKRQRRMGNLAEGVPQALTSFQTWGTFDTSPDTAIGRGDDASGESSPHGTVSSLAH